MPKEIENKKIKLTIKNVRCFSGEQHFNIRPLTFLVGENSTGKTTVMGCFNVIGNIINRRIAIQRDIFSIPDFNMEPYFMGSFQDIVTNTVSSKNSQKKTFEISLNIEESNRKYKIYFMEREEGAEPVIQKAEIISKNFVLSCDNENLTIDDKSKNIKESIEIPFKSSDNRFIYDFIKEPYFLLHFIYERNIIKNKKSDKKNKLIEIMKNIEKIFESKKYRNEMRRNIFNEHIVSLAPIRSKPKRTYDPIKEAPDPEGTEIPMTLMKLSNTGGEDWKYIREKLINFGKASGLFSDIKVKKYGKSIGEPFQLKFKVRGFQSNIRDIGYGISQILPLLVRLFSKETDPKRGRINRFRNRFLLQQPEMHLHPKARAAFSSLLVENIRRMNNFFLIETHSDYMIDRARIEIRRGNISHEDVSLIYLEPVKERVKAHNIRFDKEGNLIGTPKGYRDFFMDETDRFLGFKD